MLAQRSPVTHYAELGGGNIHEFGSGFIVWRKYWYTNNLTEDLSHKFHKTQKRKDYKGLDVPEFSEITDFFLHEIDHHPRFIGLSVDYIQKSLKLDYRYIKRMCERGLMQRGFYKPKEPKQFLFWQIRGIDEIEVMFLSRKLISTIFVKKERSGESREIRSDDLKGGLEF